MGVEKHWQTANGGLGASEMRSTPFECLTATLCALLCCFI